ncbi:long-chain fatty acid--CoA ligase [Candidatus Sumerlaeota bacterium]|nr:long-chain fatty acid--CoA ligase [Candidatus Sumerlaeota bacterium]
MRVYDYLLSAGREIPGQTALEFKGKQISYGHLADEARRVGAAIRLLGVGPGDAVGIMLPNVPQFAAALFGALMNGCRVVPMNVLLRAPEIKYLVEDSDIRLIFAWEGFLPQVTAGVRELENPPEIIVLGKSGGEHLTYHEVVKPADGFDPHITHAETPVMTLYTSGTTGKPKGAVLSNANVIANMNMMDSVFNPEPGDKFLCVLPLFHVFALNAVLIAGLKNRTTVVLHPQFVLEDTVRSLAADGITMFAGVPTMYFYILKHPEAGKIKFPHLRMCVSGGAAMPVDVMRQFEEAFGVPICEGYGLTETTVSVCCNRTDRPRKPGSIGQPYDEVQMKVVDDQGNEVPNGQIGEIAVKAPNVMSGYHNKPEATAEAIKEGWLHTGDLGYRDDENYFFIVDRKKDMIIKGGYNIYPREIEEVIYQLPQVAEAAVVGVYDEAKGETVRAVVALKPGQILTEEALAAYLDSNLAKYKLPQDYLFMDELPKGPTGKILKREIIKNWAQWNKDRAGAAAKTGAQG